MRKARRIRRPVSAGRTTSRLAAAALSGLAIVGIAAPAAVAGTAGSSLVGRAPQAFTGSDNLVSVAATSSTNAWAVGSYFLSRTHNSSPSWPSPATSLLEGVTSRQGAAWAVGQYSVEVQTSSGPISVTYSLILRWTGTRWARVHSPSR